MYQASESVCNALHRRGNELRLTNCAFKSFRWGSPLRFKPGVSLLWVSWLRRQKAALPTDSSNFCMTNSINGIGPPAVHLREQVIAINFGAVTLHLTRFAPDSLYERESPANHEHNRKTVVKEFLASAEAGCVVMHCEKKFNDRQAV
jgi:hypothetical protein